MIKQSPSIETPEKLITYQHAPMSLFPTPYPLHMFKSILNLQRPIGCLVSNLTSNPKMIHDLLESFLKYDPFLKKLVDMSKEYNKYALGDQD